MPFIPKLQFKASLLECKFWDQEISAYIQSLSPIWASQVALVVKNPPANASRCKRRRFNPWVEKILEESMMIHSSTLVWRIPLVHSVAQSWTQLKQLSTHHLLRAFQVA